MTYTLLHQADGEAAIQALQTLSEQGAELAVALLDLNLPKKSGHQIIAQMRASDRFQSVPIVVLTFSDSPRDRQTVAWQGVEHYFRKPIDPHEFFRLGEMVKTLVLGRSAGI